MTEKTNFSSPRMRQQSAALSPTVEAFPSALDESRPHPLPEHKTSGSFAADAYARLKKNRVINPGSSALIPLGFQAKNLSAHQALFIVPRSGLALNHQISVSNSPGLIDSDYTGFEVCAILINHGKKKFVVSPEDRVCQVYLGERPRAFPFAFMAVERTGGFGSTDGGSNG